MSFPPAQNPAPNRARRRHLTRTSGALTGALVLTTGGTAALLAAFAGPASAASTFTVDSNADGVADAAHCTDGTPYNCTFRDAALAAADGDTIGFDPAINVISLTGTVLTQAVNITGPADSQITITNTDVAGSAAVFTIGGTGDSSISGLAITNNQIKFENLGNKTVDRVTVTGATADSGGAISSTNSGDLAISNSILSGNTATVAGGAISAGGVGNVSITNSTIDANILGPTFSDGGGGIFIAATITGTAIANSTISGNSSSSYGGGVHAERFSGPISITNSTISGNSTAFYGGGIYVSHSQLTLNQTTISTNTAKRGGGLLVQNQDQGENVAISGSIISANISTREPGVNDDIGGYGSDVLSDHSLLGNIDTSCEITSCEINFTDVAGTIRSNSPGLGLLADNGGPTKTMELITGSAAIDTGPDPVATFVGNTSDQRGAPWLRVYNGQADIGAFEVQPVPVPPTTSTTSTTVEPTTTMSATKDEVVPVFAG